MWPRVKQQIVTVLTWGQMWSDLVALLIQTGMSKSGGKVSGEQTLSIIFYIQNLDPKLWNKILK